MRGDFESLLTQTIGLDIASVGSSAIERAVCIRMADRGLTNADEYWEFLLASKDELQELIEAVVVSETWFFRDPEAFAAMQHMLREEWAPKHPGKMLRVLSIPCATGEEPYSIAMSLLDAGFSAERFCVDAIDISANALMRAQRGVYGKNSFRGANLIYRDVHFEATPDGYRLQEEVRRQVCFKKGNALDSSVVEGVELYDVVFCRNVLIYLDGPARDRIVSVLRRLLTPNGLLLVGPSETGLLLDKGFAPVRFPLAFAFRKAGLAPPKPKENRAPPVGRPAGASGSLPKPIPLLRAPIANLKGSLQPPSQIEPRLGVAEIRRIADLGRLAEAAAHCESLLRDLGPSAEVLYLRGLIHDAAGNKAEAAEFYRKTLYLDPRHSEALAHLAVLLEQHGDATGAKMLNARLERLERQGTL